jgi:cardiolipin synthase
MRALPRDLRATRVGRLASALPEGLRDEGFERLVRRIDQSPIHRGNRVELFFRGEEAFASMQNAIEEAKEEVLLEAYILKDDATGRSFADVLARAAARGVAVRVLADAFVSSSSHASFWKEMEAHGIEVHLFHPFFKDLWYQPARDHRKILVVDRRVGFTGGMNIGDEYGSSVRHSGAKTWRDTHSRIEGPAAWEMAIVFSEGWGRADGTPFPIPPLELPPPGMPEPEGASVLILDSRPGRGHQETASVLAAILGAARRRVFMTNAYFAPRTAALGIFEAASARGVDVRLLLPGQSDVPLVRHAGHGYFRELVACGVRVFEYQPSVLHAKSLVADGFVSMVGSSNMDFRSFHFNAECNVVVFDDATAGVLEAHYDEDLAYSVEITEPAWSSRPVLHRLGDGLARKLSPFL